MVRQTFKILQHLIDARILKCDHSGTSCIFTLPALCISESPIKNKNKIKGLKDLHKTL